MSAIILQAAKYNSAKLSHSPKLYKLQTTNHKAILKDTTRNYSFKTTKLRYKLKLQCRHTITLEYYNTTVLKFTPIKENRHKCDIEHAHYCQKLISN